MAKRGRPNASVIRQNVVDLLFYMGTATGYDISKKYLTLFPLCTQRVIYYHLRKGASMGIFDVKKIAVVPGSYSWGPTSEKVFYSLGANATPNRRNEIEETSLGSKNN